MIDLTKQMLLEDAQQIVGQVVENPASAASQELIAKGAVSVATATILARTGRLGQSGETLATDLLYDGQPNLDAGIFPFVYKSYVPGHVTIVPDPLNMTARKVMRLAIADTDRPYSGATNPRADFETYGYFTNGSDLYYSDTFLIPAAFPTLTSAGWFQINEVYGPPHGGSPPVQISLVPGLNGRAALALSRDKAHNYDRPWKGPTLDAKWHTVTVHTKSATDNTGFVEVYFDGVIQRFTNGSTRLFYTTLVSGVNWDGHTPNFLNINSYRKAYAYPGVVTLYHAGARIGKTLASVWPLSTTWAYGPIRAH